MLKQIKETIKYIEKRVQFQVEIGIILGTGLGGLVNEIDIKYSLSYEEIPNFPTSTVKGHQGKLIFGILGGKNIVALQGRFHFYEGYSMQELSFPIRIMKYLGIHTLIVSNASGGMNPDFKIGDIMIINDHINLIADNPLIGKNEDSMGPRFLNMHDAYDEDLILKASEIAKKKQIDIKIGVYASVSGPCFETPAEYKYLHIIGADAVGMSTVPEVIVARHMGIRCFAMSVITDLGIIGKAVEVSHDEVIEAAKNSEPKMTAILKELLYSM